MSAWDRFKHACGQFAEPAQPAPAPEAEQGPALVGVEIASTGEGRDITRGYVDGLFLLQPEDALLVGKLGGDLDGYRAIFSDPEVKIAWDQRALGLIAREWYVEPGADDRKSKQAADQAREILTHIGWDEATRKMQLGVFWGHAFAECLWATDGATITLDSLKVKKPKRFGFRPDGTPVLLTMRQPMGEPLPPRKFWRFASGALDDDEPYGLGLAHWLYWPVWFRRNGDKFWAVYLEKFGMPTAVGKHPPGAEKAERDKLLQAVRAVHRDSAITISNNMLIELLEAVRASGADYDKFVQRWITTIYRLIVGQDFSITGAGGQYKGDNLMDVQRSLIKADADLINVSFARQVGRWLADWNFPGATPPRIWRRVEDAPDLASLSDTHSKLFTVGYRPTLDQVSETYGGEWEPVPVGTAPTGGDPNPPPPAPDAPPVEMAEDTARPPARAGTGCPTCAAFAEAGPPDALDDLRDLALDGWKAQMEPLVNPLFAELDAAIARGETVAQFRAKLPGLMEKMPVDQVVAALTEAGFVARLAGEVGIDVNS
ncbi:DUF935 domain-containing protein [Methylomagnum ishizawai]|uniref:DUF935 domain-containing protein n=1 Tax=Methylomagnum ishizawai TaxID=1760988 RepID=UPI001C3232A8|nr:DUF935 family protein [Methylomagnum ishizawai]BBL73663.1 hypothetical protein MishRS11D_07610 [Methylomagnum ishizawai]